MRAGRLVRIHRGVYAVGHDALRQEGRWLAAVLACGPGAALSHAAAAAALELRSSSAVLVDVSVTRQLRRQAGIRPHRPRHLGDHELTTVSGIAVTDATRTVIDLARSSARFVENVAAAAEHRGLLDYARIDADAPPALRTILGRGPKLTRARCEERLLAALRDAGGLAEPDTNVWLTHGAGEQWQPDLLWRAERVIVELDDDTHRTARAFELDRAKDVARQADGYLTPRFTLRQIDTDLPAVVGQIVRLVSSRQPA